MPLTTTGEPGHYDLLSDNIYLWMERGRARRPGATITGEARQACLASGWGGSQ
jgi:hypothetical protein